MRTNSGIGARRVLPGALGALAVSCVLVSAPASPARGDVIYFTPPYILKLSRQFARPNMAREQEYFRRVGELSQKYTAARATAMGARTAVELKAAVAAQRRYIEAIAALPRPSGKKDSAKRNQNRFKMDLRRVRSENPGLSQSDAIFKLAFGGRTGRGVRALMKFMGALAPAPMFLDDRGFYFHGTIVEYIKGLHRSLKDPDSLDQMVFRAYGRNGERKSPKAVRLPAQYTTFIYHDYDTPKDFVWRFSNRHELLKAPFGSTRHRQSIYALFDGDGEMGLSGGARPRFGRGLEEGLITRFLIEGVPPHDEQFKRLTWNRVAPYGFSGMIQNSIRKGGFKVAELQPYRLFLAMARARVYNVDDPRVAKLARHGAAILCTMALADPEIALGARRSIARRARRLGLGCYEGVLDILSEYWENSDKTALRRGVLTVDHEIMQQAVLEFVLSENVFRHFLGANYQNWQGQLRLDKPTHSISYEITEMLAEIGMGLRARHAGTVRQKLATAALERMITTAPGATPEDIDYNELQSRTHRDALLTWATGVSTGRASNVVYDWKARWVWIHAMFCRVGWGHGDDIVPTAIFALKQAMKLIANDEGGEPAASNRSEIERNLRLIAWIRKTARRDDPHEKKLLDEIDKELDKIRQRAGQTRSDREKKVYRRFFGTLEELVAAGGRCT